MPSSPRHGILNRESRSPSSPTLRSDTRATIVSGGRRRIRPQGATTDAVARSRKNRRIGQSDLPESETPRWILLVTSGGGGTVQGPWKRFDLHNRPLILLFHQTLLSSTGSRAGSSALSLLASRVLVISYRFHRRESRFDKAARNLVSWKGITRGTIDTQTRAESGNSNREREREREREKEKNRKKIEIQRQTERTQNRWQRRKLTRESVKRISLLNLASCN